MIPGSNLLSMALSVIAPQTVSYYRFTGNTVNAIRNKIPSYADPVDILGSLQPVARALYSQYGLDLSKKYFILFTENNLIAVDRSIAGDQISVEGVRYECLSATEWFNLDGWVEILCVRIAPANV